MCRVGRGNMRAITVLILMLVASPCLADGAIAVSKDGIKHYGIANNLSSVAEANSGALHHCDGGRTGLCSVVLNFRNECAIVGNTMDRMIYTRGKDLHEARQNFLKQCSGPCKVGLSACDGSVLEAEPEIATPNSTYTWDTAATEAGSNEILRLGVAALTGISSVLGMYYNAFLILAAVLLWAFAFVFFVFGRLRRDVHNMMRFLLAPTIAPLVASVAPPDEQLEPPATLAELIARSDPTPPTNDEKTKPLSETHFFGPHNY